MCISWFQSMLNMIIIMAFVVDATHVQHGNNYISYLQRALHSDPSPHVVRELKADSEWNAKWQLGRWPLAQLQALNLNRWACFGSHCDEHVLWYRIADGFAMMRFVSHPVTSFDLLVIILQECMHHARR